MPEKSGLSPVACLFTIQNPVRLTKHYSGCWRVSNSTDRFAQIKRVGNKWQAEIRDTEFGDLLQFDGWYDTLAEGVEWVRGTLARTGRRKGR